MNLTRKSFHEFVERSTKYFKSSIKLPEIDTLYEEQRQRVDLVRDPLLNRRGRSYDFLIDLEANCGERCHTEFLTLFSPHKYRVLSADLAMLFTTTSEIDMLTLKRSIGMRQYILMLPAFKLDADLRKLTSTAITHRGRGAGEVKLTVIIAPLDAEEVELFYSEVAKVTKNFDEEIEWLHLPPFEGAADRQWVSVVRVINRSAIERILNSLTDMRQVLWVEQKHKIHTSNRWAAGVCQSGTYSSKPLFRANLTGSGEVIGISDTGLDMSSTYFYDPSYHNVPYDTIDYRHRKVVTYISTYGDKVDDSEGHGTHVCGIASGSCHNNDNNCRAFNGVAPDAKIAFSDIGKSGYGGLSPPNSVDTGLFQPLYQAGARIFSNSWGASQDNSYNYMSADSDRFMWNYPDALILYAVGNNGTGSDTGASTVAAPSTLKSGIAVGATLNDYNSFLTYNGGGGVSAYQSVDSLAAFSSRGPTKDGRMKPDIVAPGWWVASAGSSNTGSSSYDSSDFDVHGKLRVLRGTSMATPAAAASAALIRQYFREGYYPTGSANAQDGFIPSGALLKAMLIHSTELLSRVVTLDYKGYSSLGDLSGPDHNQGYGRIRLNNVLHFGDGGSSAATAVSLFVVGAADSSHPLYRRLRTGEYHEYTFTTPATKASIITITMAYTDYPAAYGASVPLINNLDVAVYLDSTTSASSEGIDANNRKPTSFAGLKDDDGAASDDGEIGDDGLPITSTERYFPADYESNQSKINTVEKIILNNPKLGVTYKVRVFANGALSSAQPYALVISGNLQDFDSSVDHGFRDKVVRAWRSVTGAMPGVKYESALTIGVVFLAATALLCILHRICITRRRRYYTTYRDEH